MNRKALPLFLVLLAGCGGKSTTPGDAAPAAPAPVAEAPQAAGALTPSAATQKAPEVFKVRFDTTQGPFVVEVHRAWAPNGADRFYNLARIGYYDGATFFRVLSGFMAQVGIHGDPSVSALWRDANIPDDPATGQSNKRGMVTFAMGGPNTRTTQIFFNYGDNSRLDAMGFPPFGKVVEGMENLDKLYSGYGEGAPRGPGPDQSRIQFEGSAYLRAEFPKLDSIRSAKIE